MHPFTSRRRDTVAALGEVALINAIQRWLGAVTPPPPFGIGDDCAVLPAAKRLQLVTVDPVIFGRHFDASVSPREVGEKLLKRNLSDIAAMGGRPRAAVIALTLDATTRTAWVEGFYRGLAATARRYNVAIVGGDVAQAEGTLIASLTLLGEATTARVLTRSGAQVGDWIYVTGELGNTLATGHHHRFTPRLAEGAWLAGQRDVRAMMDLSDGLAKDLLALMPPQGSPALAEGALPLRRGATVANALSDGEDYELLFTLAPTTDHVAFQRRWARRFPRLRLTRIGRIVRPNAMPETALNLAEYHGYEHLR